MEFSLQDMMDAVQYGFKYHRDSQNDNVEVPTGNILQWLMYKKDLLEVPQEFKDLKSKE